MKGYVERMLRELTRQIEPTPTQKAGAKRSHIHLRKLLQTGDMERRILDDYLSGSYRRNTAIYPLDDVDIIFVIDPNCWPKPMLGFADRPDPSVVLRSFADALRHRYPQTAAHSQRRSIRVELNHLDIDCVPAIAIPNSDFIWVGDRRRDTWVRSSPKAHEDAVIAGNSRNGGLLVPIVKLLKAWNRGLPDPVRVRSFVVETMAVWLFENVEAESLEHGLLLYFDFVSNFAREANYTWESTYGMSMDVWNYMVVPDKAGTGSNVASGVGYGRLQDFRRNAVSTRDGILHATRARLESSVEDHLRSALHIGA